MSKIERKNDSKQLACKRVSFKATVDLHVCYDDCPSESLKIRLKAEQLPHSVVTAQSSDTNVNKMLRKHMSHKKRTPMKLARLKN